MKQFTPTKIGQLWEAAEAIGVETRQLQQCKWEGRKDRIKEPQKRKRETDRIGVSQVMEPAGLWELQVGAQEQL